MKIRTYSILFLAIATLLPSCERDDPSPQNDLENSHRILLNFKETTRNSYTYTVVNSTWTGSSWETTLTVSNGTLVQRHFKYTATRGLADIIPEEELEWTENENEIGNHEHTGAAAPLTLDEIYARAGQEWLLKRENAKTYFETKNNGLISTCGYVENGCMDDCFVGITIKSIEAL